ncbi:MAG: metallophosphoesterase, partial [Pseudomonadota bacterium]
KMKKIFIISDLHLGGRPDERDDLGQITKPGFQICHAYPQLTAFIDWINKQAKDFNGDTEIIINGDIVDFLADDDFDDPTINATIWTANETEAISKLNQIIKRTREGQNRGPFDALKEFIAQGNQLTLILGNHDIELALPQVRRHLQNILGAQQGKLQIIYDGEAYTCGDLLIEHGNRYDSWNVVDHSALRQERSMLSRGLKVDEQERGKQYFLPPAGTLMVIHLINHLKKHYRFVDLLKPETGAVIPLLLALKADYGILQDILSLSPQLTMRKIRGRLDKPAKPSHNGNLKASRRSSPPTQNLLSDILQEMLGENAALFIQSQRGNLSASRRQSPNLKILLNKAQKFANTLLVTAEELEKQDNIKRLHVALKRLKTDFSFDIHQEESNYLEAAKEIIDTGKFYHVVFGHTHLPKQIDLGKNGQYLNTGTWADVIRLPAQIMEDNEAATKALTDFIEAMRHNELSHYIKRDLSYVEVTLNDNKVTDAKLQNFCGAERERALTTFPM